MTAEINTFEVEFVSRYQAWRLLFLLGASFTLWLFLSLLLHAGLLAFFYMHRVEGFNAPEARIEPEALDVLRRMAAGELPKP